MAHIISEAEEQTDLISRIFQIYLCKSGKSIFISIASGYVHDVESQNQMFLAIK